MKFFSQIFGKFSKRKSYKNSKTKKCKNNKKTRNRNRRMKGGQCSSCKLF